MSELTHVAEESVERRAGDRLNSAIALLVALTATVLALVNIKDGNVVQAMSVARTQAANAWSYFQAKSTKQALAQAALDQLELQAELFEGRPEVKARLVARVEQYRGNVDRYEREKAEVRQKAEAFEKEYERLNVVDDQLDIAEACLSMALALYGVTALLGNRRLLWLSVLVAGGGFALAVGAFAGWTYRPEWFARLLS